jgi:hypothetical protein
VNIFETMSIEYCIYGFINHAKRFELFPRT